MRDRGGVRPWVLAALALACAAASGRARADERVGLVDAMRERILAHLALHPAMRVADIGVGGGWFVIRIAETIGPDGVVYGTDIDANAIASLQRKLPDIRPNSGRVDLRLCRDERDSALDDLPDGHVDLVLMIDSLCFDAQVPRERNVAYLRRFLRVLRPGGRLVHHMDCRCDISAQGVIAQFSEAGFAPNVESLDVAPDPASIPADWPCRTEAERARHAFVAVFRKPGAASGSYGGRRAVAARAGRSGENDW